MISEIQRILLMIVLPASVLEAPVKLNPQRGFISGRMNCFR